MIDIETERVLIAYTDALFGDVDDNCPKKKLAYELMESIRQDNNQEILEQIGFVSNAKCNPKCPKRVR